MPMSSYDYACLRLVPRVEREEFLNVGLILFCRTRRFLDARIELDPMRLRALGPGITEEEIAQIRTHLDLIPRICAGEGPIGALGQAEAFHWLVAPHNTMIQASPVHSGLCDDPAVELARLAGVMGIGSGRDNSEDRRQ
ncbi:MAG: DUF3037 domain-containing protein [Caldilineaceae bacterium]|nr:DUF3037 domain-containing protein [Caldilineaceae bacterium]